MTDDEDTLEEWIESSGPRIPSKPRRYRTGFKPQPILPHPGEEDEATGLIKGLTREQEAENAKVIRAWRRDPYIWNREKDKREMPLAKQKTFVVYLVDIDRKWIPVTGWIHADDTMKEVEHQLSLPHRYGLTHVGLVNWRYEVNPRKLPKIENLDDWYLDKDQKDTNDPKLIFVKTYPIRKRK